MKYLLFVTAMVTMMAGAASAQEAGASTNCYMITSIQSTPVSVMVQTRAGIRPTEISCSLSGSADVYDETGKVSKTIAFGQASGLTSKHNCDIGGRGMGYVTMTCKCTPPYNIAPNVTMIPELQGMKRCSGNNIRIAPMPARFRCESTRGTGSQSCNTKI